MYQMYDKTPRSGGFNYVETVKPPGSGGLFARGLIINFTGDRVMPNTLIHPQFHHRYSTHHVHTKQNPLPPSIKFTFSPIIFSIYTNYVHRMFTPFHLFKLLRSSALSFMLDAELWCSAISSLIIRITLG